MAWTFYHEDRRDAYDWFLRLRDLIIAHGGAILASGDGNALYSASGDVITGGTPALNTTTAGFLANNLAWMRLRLPGSGGSDVRELCIQHRNLSSPDGFIVWFSRVGFTGGAPSATVRPTAVDEWRILGSGDTSGQSPSPDTFGQSSGIYAAHLDACFGDADEGFAFYCLARRANSIRIGGFIMDAVSEASPDDEAPYVYTWLVGTDVSSGGARFQTVPTSYPARQPDFMWGLPSGGPFATTTQPRPHGLVRPTDFNTGMDPYGVFRVIASPVYARGNLQPSPAIPGAGGEVVKGYSRLFVAIGDGAAPELSRIAVPSEGLCIQSGNYVLRWDGTTPRY